MRPETPAHPDGTPDDSADEAPDEGNVGELVARLTDPTRPLGRREQGRALGSLSGALLGSARAAGRASVLGGRWLTDLLIDTAPRIPLRDLSTLRQQHPGLTDEELAEALVAAAAKASGNAVFPSAIAAKFSNETPTKQRFHTCLDQYRANKASGANGGLKWVQKGGGYYSQCNAQLKK